MRSLSLIFSFLVISLGWSANTTAAECSADNYRFETQAEIDALGATGCDSVRGWVVVAGPSIDNIDGLSNIKSIGYELSIGNTALTNLDALSNLTSIGVVLNIRANPLLEDIDGLANLTSTVNINISDNDELTTIDGLANVSSAGDFLQISNNDSLTNVNGLANLKEVGGRLDIGANENLLNIDGLASLTHVGSHVYISSNYALLNIDGLANLSSVGESLAIQDNPALLNLDGLVSLTSVEDLTIWANNQLTNVDGLLNLTMIRGSLTILRNSSLQNLDGLTSHNQIGLNLTIEKNDSLIDLNGLVNLSSVGSLRIVNNSALSSCEALAPLLGWPNGPSKVSGAVTFSSNPQTCDSQSAIRASVSGPTQPVISNAIATPNGHINFEIEPSTTPDALFPVTGYETSCSGASIDVTQTEAATLRDNTPVTQTLLVSGYDPVSVLSDIEVDIDITHSDPSDLFISLTTPAGTELILWNRGNNGSVDIAGTFPTTLTAIDDIESISAEAMDGLWELYIEDIDVGPLVREGVLNSWGVRIAEEIVSSVSSSDITIQGASSGREYTCVTAPITKLGVMPESLPFSVTVPNGDGDLDLDGFLDGDDNCPSVANEDQADFDSDGEGDVCDSDDDNDGTNDEDDAFPFDDTESLDTDGDGIGNNQDSDDDADGILDGFDYQPLAANSILRDTDADGVIDAVDAYPNNPTKQFSGSSDLDGDGFSNDEEIDYCTNPFDERSQPDIGGLNPVIMSILSEQGRP